MSFIRLYLPIKGKTVVFLPSPSSPSTPPPPHTHTHTKVKGHGLNFYPEKRHIIHPCIHECRFMIRVGKCINEAHQLPDDSYFHLFLFASACVVGVGLGVWEGFKFVEDEQSQKKKKKKKKENLSAD